MPCLFVRVFDGHRVAEILPEVTPGCEWVLAGEGTASRKWDGTACMVRDGVLYKRYDAKRGKTPPPGAIPCSEPDPVTGHWPHWVRVGEGPEDQWYRAAFARYGYDTPAGWLPDGTYELCGPHFNGNPEGLAFDGFLKHGDVQIHFPTRAFEAIRTFLENNRLEGVVFAHPDGRMCKIRRDDFDLPWGRKGRK